VNQTAVRSEEIIMSYNHQAIGQVGVAGQGHLPATAQATSFAARPGHPERRDWRKRRKVRARRASGLRSIWVLSPADFDMLFPDKPRQAVKPARHTRRRRVLQPALAVAKPPLQTVWRR